MTRNLYRIRGNPAKETWEGLEESRVASNEAPEEARWQETTVETRDAYKRKRRVAVIEEQMVNLPRPEAESGKSGAPRTPLFFCGG